MSVLLIVAQFGRNGLRLSHNQLSPVRLLLKATLLRVTGQCRCLSDYSGSGAIDAIGAVKFASLAWTEAVCKVLDSSVKYQLAGSAAVIGAAVRRASMLRGCPVAIQR
jgi:hypothetical protein